MMFAVEVVTPASASAAYLESLQWVPVTFVTFGLVGLLTLAARMVKSAAAQL